MVFQIQCCLSKSQAA